MKTKILPCLIAALALSLAACSSPAPQTAAPAADGFPWLDTLDSGDGAKESGKRIMALPAGLTRVDRTGDSVLLVGVHGFESPGYEWVHPLQKLDDDTNEVGFFHWDWKRCPAEAAADLDTAIGKAIEANPKITRVVLVGHSMGGLVVSEAAYGWTRATPLEAHVVASPIASIGKGPRCPGAALSARTLPSNATVAQWRTRHELDGAFKDTKPDPQVIELKGVKSTLLPESYKGNRLGHNWSISWVADTLKGETPAP
jgi:pimeloyl-ACP methyl ester carboxylesterase